MAGLSLGLLVAGQSASRSRATVDLQEGELMSSQSEPKRTQGSEMPPSPFPPSVEGFQVLLLAGGGDPSTTIGILSALENEDD